MEFIDGEFRWPQKAGRPAFCGAIGIIGIWICTKIKLSPTARLKFFNLLKLIKKLKKAAARCLIQLFDLNKKIEISEW